MEPVSVSKVAGEFDCCPAEGEAYLNRKTGECYLILDSLDSYEDGELDGESEEMLNDKSPAWQKEAREKEKEIAESDDWIMLPPKSEFHEYAVLESFTASRKDPREREMLEIAIEGKGAFGRFKNTVTRLGLRDEWFKYKEEALAEFIAEWLDAQGIPHGP